MRGREGKGERGEEGRVKQKQKGRQNFPGIQKGLNLVLPLVSCEKFLEGSDAWTLSPQSGV